MSDLEGISCHIDDRISSVQRMLYLSIAEVPQQKMKKLAEDLDALERLLMEYEKNVDQHKAQLDQLKALDEFFTNNLKRLQHLKNNVPAHMPSTCPQNEIHLEPPLEPVSNKSQAAGVESTQQEIVKTDLKKCVKEILPITVGEFENIPPYMKGRVSYHQINSAVENINAAVVAKYKIVHQPVKTRSNRARNLYQRFKDQETKETKGSPTAVVSALAGWLPLTSTSFWLDWVSGAVSGAGIGAYFYLHH
ncbi:spindle and kinetochore-associated protein 1 isoform X2 [Corythoichthys intestinalis]|uniref:spindle and kinetochore-associated protein 1 isoform X2 n=1 Tax=Corythoichthys intestinalis TaxID=161448 RepID=UPI0025A534CB|nr:spindle and kinetochore-associated protein 1 isoform X2 [Corythoichthys intestinalis]